MNDLTPAVVQRLVAFVFTCIALSGPAIAQQPGQAQVNAIRQACRGDYQTHCASVPPGGSAALACLKQNVQSLSPACQRAVNGVAGAAPSTQGQAPAPTAPLPAAPAAPAPAAPPPAAPAYRAPPSPLSPRQEAMLLRRACRPDFRTYCAGVPPGGGRIITCLEANGPYLSRQCRSALISARRGG